MRFTTAALKDLHYGLRIMRGSPGPTAVAILTLALGIGANTTVFGWIDSLLMRPIPGVANSHELVSIETIGPGNVYLNTSYRDYRDYRDGLTNVSGTAASLLNAFNLGSDDRPQRTWGEYVSGNYFAVLGVAAERGRVLVREEYSDAPGAHPVAVISHRMWRTMFRGDPAAIGRTLRVNRHELTIVGVTPPDFRGTVPGLALDLWIPMVMAPQLNGQGNWLLDARTERQVWINARLRPGVSVEQSRQEAAALAARIATANPKTSAGFTATVLPVWQSHYGAHALLSRPLQVLMAVCLVVFLIAAANIANLQLARAVARQREFGVRLALGAGRLPLFRQLMAESLPLAIIGSLGAILIALWMGQSLEWLMPPIHLPLALGVNLGPNVILFVVLLCTVATLLTGLAPALHCMRGNLVDSLRDGARGSSAGGFVHRTRGMLVVAQVALALIALVGAGLFARSFTNAQAIHPGFNPENVLFAQIQVETFCRTPEERQQFSRRLRERLETLPAISRVSYANAVPLDFGTGPWSDMQVEGYVPAAGENMRIAGSNVDPGYFDALGIPLLEGRDFTDRDDPSAPSVAIVNQTFARRYFAGVSPVGRKMFSGGKWRTIVGLVKDSKYESVTEPPTPYFHRPFRQASGGEFWIAFFMKTTMPPKDMVNSVRREAGFVHPSAAVAEIVPFTERLSSSLYEQKVAASLLAVLGTLCLALTAAGLYSVIAYAVTQRTNEIGIRMALGASRIAVLGMVLRQGLALTGAGIALGVVGAFLMTRLISGMLVGVSATDPLVFAGAALFLAGVAALSSYLPARRATSVDPVVALRCN